MPNSSILDLIENQSILKHAIVSETAGFAVQNPANGDILGYAPDVPLDEIDRIVERASQAFREWRARTAKERSQILRRWFDLVMENQKDLAIILSAEQGKPINEAMGEIAYGASFIEWFGEEAKRVYGDTIPEPSHGRKIITIKRPIGVVAAITPWNFPNAMITRKAGPALAVGCTMVLKPASATPFSAYALEALAREAGFPKDVFRVVSSQNARQTGELLAKHPTIAKLTFTGSTEVGRTLLEQSASTIKKVSLELGGNAPFIVFDDADLDAAVEGAIASKFRNTGQTCVCANRILVQDGVYDAFAKKLAKAVSAMAVGPALEGDFDQGALINQAAVDKVEEHISDAILKGATVVVGGQLHQRGGTFFEPTVLKDVTTEMLVAHEETFGPVAPLFRFKTEAEAIELANDTEFGLASYFYARDIGRVWRVAEAIEAGMVGINEGIISTEVAPFGGVKQSGLGREGSKYGIDDYVEIKYIAMGGLGA